MAETSILVRGPLVSFQPCRPPGQEHRPLQRKGPAPGAGSGLGLPHPNLGCSCSYIWEAWLPVSSLPAARGQWAVGMGAGDQAKVPDKSRS